jgi:hypothetical protein
MADIKHKEMIRAYLTAQTTFQKNNKLPDKVAGPIDLTYNPKTNTYDYETEKQSSVNFIV